MGQVRKSQANLTLLRSVLRLSEKSLMMSSVSTLSSEQYLFAVGQDRAEETGEFRAGHAVDHPVVVGQ